MLGYPVDTNVFEFCLKKLSFFINGDGWSPLYLPAFPLLLFISAVISLYCRYQAI